jgi:hypothetical protein
MPPQESSRFTKAWIQVEPTPEVHVTRGTPFRDKDGSRRVAKLDGSLHMQRDGLAAPVIASSLNIRWAGPIFNLNPGLFGLRQARKDRITSLFCSTDLLLRTTRFPLNDNVPDPDRGGRIKILKRSGSYLESQWQSMHELFFSHCDRSATVLSDKVMRAKGVCENANLPPIQSTLYLQNGVGLIDGRADVGGDKWKAIEPLGRNNRPGTTYAFALYVPSLGELPCGGLAVFGMGGTGTLLSAHLFSTEYADDLRRLIAKPSPGIMIVEFQANFSDTEVPITLRDVQISQHSKVLDVRVSAATPIST